MAPKKLMFSLCSGEMCVRSSSSIRRLDRRIKSTASVLYSVVQVTTELATKIRHQACSAWSSARVARSMSSASWQSGKSDAPELARVDGRDPGSASIRGDRNPVRRAGEGYGAA